jgi:hypothetical protein
MADATGYVKKNAGFSQKYSELKKPSEIVQRALFVIRQMFYPYREIINFSLTTSFRVVKR